MTEYSIDELRDIIAAGEAKIDELEATSNRIGGSDEVLDGVIDGLIERVSELRNELDLLEQQAEEYEQDRLEAIGLYVEEGGELDETGMPLDDGLFCDVFFQMQEERIENGLL